MKTYKVVLHPKSGTNGGTLNVTVQAADKAKAQNIAESQYGSKYKISVQG